jgi:hypothetical protein
MSNSFHGQGFLSAMVRICLDRGALMVAQALEGLNFLHVVSGLGRFGRAGRHFWKRRIFAAG